MSFQNILIVCVGNICRSPMAEALFKQAYPEKSISSAGMEGLVGYPADRYAVECMNDVGIDISMHIARRLDVDMLIRANLVLAMTSQQVKMIEERWSFSKGKVFKICHWSDQNVADPYQKEKFEFIAAKKLIEEGVRDWMSHL
jgi:protein-tyrosine phosphatase